MEVVLIQMCSQVVSVSGNTPLPRFGHTITQYFPGKLVLFGGATGQAAQFSMHDSSYTLDLSTRVWSKLETTGTTPSARAAHASVSHQQNQILVYGGATEGGGLASDDLYLLDLKDDIGIWNTITVIGKTPGRRYGHTLTYAKPLLVLFGGVSDNQMNDCWVMNIKKQPVTWLEVKCRGALPSPRAYHSAALCESGSTNGMILMFGGRSNKEAVNDIWGLVRHTDGRHEWLKAPQQGNIEPVARYQHACLFYGPFLLIVGGKSDKHDDPLPTQSYDVRSNKWSTFDVIERFRHCAFLTQTNLYVHGGFPTRLKMPSAPTDSLLRLELSSLIRKAQTDIISSRTQIPEPRQRQNRLRILDPVLAESSQRPLSTKNDLPAYFLNNLMQPHKYRSTDHTAFKFRTDHILSLVAMFQDIVKKQPVLLRVQAPVKIFGDIHGQFSDLMSFMEFYGAPHQAGRRKDIENYDYLFLGDYVDRGAHSLETILLLMALKVTYPTQVHLIRGNHEDICVNEAFGFMEECAEKCDQDPEEEGSVFRTINRAFEWMPLAALVQDSILCVHGGIGANVHTLEDISNIQRPIAVSQEITSRQSKIILDLLWSDPTDNDSELGIQNNWMRDPNHTGNIVKYGPDVVENFLKKNNLGMIIRAHECVHDGFERFANGQLITVFSATDYCRTYKNSGAILIVKTNLEIIPKLIKPNSNDQQNWRQNEQTLKKRPPTPPRNSGRR